MREEIIFHHRGICLFASVMIGRLPSTLLRCSMGPVMCVLARLTLFSSPQGMMSASQERLGRGEKMDGRGDDEDELGKNLGGCRALE